MMLAMSIVTFVQQVGEGRVAVDVLTVQDRGRSGGEINNLDNAAAMHVNLTVRDG